MSKTHNVPSWLLSSDFRQTLLRMTYGWLIFLQVVGIGIFIFICALWVEDAKGPATEEPGPTVSLLGKLGIVACVIAWNVGVFYMRRYFGKVLREIKRVREAGQDTAPNP